MIELNVDDFIDDNQSAVIVCYPTGVKYTVQAGGTGCTHPSAEGFLLIFWDFDIDDCSYGCFSLNRLPDKRLELANHMNDLLIKETKGNRRELEFDFSRVDQLQEGWWPVKIEADFGYWKMSHLRGLGGFIMGIMIDLSFNFMLLYSCKP
jgi:hypothetical protein